MGFSARLLNRDFEDLVICYLCKEVLEDVIALACCFNHCCRKCFDNRKRAGDRCVEECGAQIENLIEDRPKKQELCEVGDFQCTRCFFKPLRYDQLVGHMRNECARRDVHCRYCDLGCKPTTPLCRFLSTFCRFFRTDKNRQKNLSKPTILSVFVGFFVGFEN